MSLQVASQRLLRMVAREVQFGARGSSGWDYLSQPLFQLRERLHELRCATPVPSASWAEETAAVLRELNAHTGARFRNSDVPVATRLIVETMDQRGWWSNEPPVLLGSSANDADQLAAAVTESLNRIQTEGARRPYALVTRFLNCLWPETFAIADHDSAQSIWMWAVFAFDDEAQTAKLESFRASHTYDDRGAGGYRTILEFYRLLWTSASEVLREEVVTGVRNLEQQYQLKYDSNAPITVLDAVHALMHRASGNPIRLGLAEPLPVKP